MNRITYFFLNKLYDCKTLNQKYIEYLYNYYEQESQLLHYSMDISKEDFEDIFKVIYDTLRLRIDEESFSKVCEHYLKLLISDAVDGNIVDTNWFIQHVWYLCVGISNTVDIKEYNDCILFIQENLIKKFNIKESTKEKLSRKIYTKFLIK